MCTQPFNFNLFPEALRLDMNLPSNVFSSLAMNRLLLAIFSGVTYNSFKSDFLSTIALWTAFTSSFVQFEFKKELAIFSSFRAISWSSIKEINGETTSVIPLEITAGSWKQRLLPPPVGIIKMQSFPAIVALMHSSWNGRNVFIVNTSSLAFSTSSDQGKFFADQSLSFSFFCDEEGKHLSTRLHICDCMSSLREWRICCLSSKSSICVSISLSSLSISSSSFDTSMASEQCCVVKSTKRWRYIGQRVPNKQTKQGFRHPFVRHIKNLLLNPLESTKASEGTVSRFSCPDPSQNIYVIFQKWKTLISVEENFYKLSRINSRKFRPRLHGSGQIFARTKTCTVPPCLHMGPADLDEVFNGKVCKFGTWKKQVNFLTGTVPISYGLV